MDSKFHYAKQKRNRLADRPEFFGGSAWAYGQKRSSVPSQGGLRSFGLTAAPIDVMSRIGVLPYLEPCVGSLIVLALCSLTGRERVEHTPVRGLLQT